MDVTISSRTHAFDHDYPAPETVESVHEEQQLMQAVEAYRFFYPTVSAEGLFEAPRSLGIADGKGLIVLAAGPRHVLFTANSDTPYATGVLDLAAMGPVVIDVPAGPLIGLVNDHHQRWIVDMGIPGRDAGRGGKFLLLPPDFEGEHPAGYHVARSTTFKVLFAMRALPRGEIADAVAALREVKVHALARPNVVLPYVDATERAFDGTPVRWEDNITYWRRLHAAIQDEPVADEYRPLYGQLASLGIEKGRGFAPDGRLHALLETAARLAIDEMRVEGFASERADRIVWPDRQWEWIVLTPDSPTFETESFLDLEARDRWFFQAILTSPAMFRRQVGGGSVYWLASRDRMGAYLDGNRTYKLVVPAPVPASLFWSVTVYDAKTRSQVMTPQGRAVRGSLQDRFAMDAGDVEIYLGPKPPPGHENRWIQTVPGHGFFVYFRVYGPQAAALDGRWKPGDLELAELPARVEPVVAERFTGEELERRAVQRRASEAALWGMSLVNFERMAHALVHDARGAFNQVLYWSRLGDWKNQMLTPNVDVIYAMPFFTTKIVGPMVLEIPPADDGSITGTIMDAWQAALEDVGPAGLDKGRGGRYLILPPSYREPVPEGFYVLPSDTFHGFALLRSVLRGDTPADLAKAVAYARRIALYPLSRAAQPPTTVFVDAADIVFDATLRFDSSFFESLHRMIQTEPWLERDSVMIDVLRSIGIAKDEPFDVEPHRLVTLDQAIADVHEELDARFETAFAPFYDGGRWFVPITPELVESQATFFEQAGAYTIDARALMYYAAFSSIKHLGGGQFYLFATRDREGDVLDGGRNYRLAVPANPPVHQFWSATVYDRATHALIRNVMHASRSSLTPGLDVNADGTVELWLGPEAPPGKASNWIPTRPGCTFEVALRFYGPTRELYEKRWRIPDLEAV